MTEAEAAPPRRRLLGDLDIPYVVETGVITFGGWCALLVVVTFAAYWYLGPQDTAYSYQVQQANNIIHGHLDLVEEYTPTLGVLERVLYDGEGFCLPADDPRGREDIENPRITDDCKTYMQHSLGPAFIVLPGVLLFGVELNQTLVSAVFGAMTAPLVFAIAGTLSQRRYVQLTMTALMLFGTTFWWVASNGGVWFFAHTTATFFLFAAIYFTLVRPNTLMAGVCLGAAFMCRPTTIMTGLFFVIMFSHLWLRPAAPGQRLLDRIDFSPITSFAAGLAPLLLATLTVNYLRFDNPLESGYNYSEQVHQDRFQELFKHGILDPRYITRHPPVALEQMPLLDTPDTSCGERECAWIRPSFFGTAIWATTPPFLLALVAGIWDRRIVWIGGGLVALACAFLLSRAVADAFDSGWANQNMPLGVHLLPFWAMIGVSILYAFRNSDRLVLACWAAIIPTALVIFSFAATGWAQFGYRYALDFTPFLWLLAAHVIGDRIRWYVWPLIIAAFAMSAMGVLWHYQFQPDHTWGWEWVTF
ncbi:MAG TPA: hypothetical protein VMR52_12405 [Dehalococcoidia bacterium]|nr:hypothetical protein [Dehalococcoidia bacterium]